MNTQPATSFPHSTKNNFFLIFIVSAIILFFSWFNPLTPKLNSLHIQSEDTVPSLLTPYAILKDHTLYLDKYYTFMRDRYPQPDDKDFQKDLTPFYLKKIGSHYISAFPLVTPLVSLPVFVLPVLFNMPLTWDNLAVLGHLSGSLIVALAGAFLYLTLIKHFKLVPKKALLLTGVFLFGTVNFALLSQAMWQHGTLELFTILGIYFFLNYLSKPEKSSHMFLSGLFYGLAVLARPTAALSMVLLQYFLLIRFNKDIKHLIKIVFPFLLGFLLDFAFFVWYNKTFYLGIQNEGYASQIFTNWLSPFPISFLGVWLSPNKGILIYSPVLIFSLVGLYRAIKEKVEGKGLYLLFGFIVLFHTLIISLWKHWYGGWSFGYRMSSDILPFLIFLLVPYVSSPVFSKSKSLFYVLFGLSVAVEVFGLVFFDGIWHAAYDQGFTNTAWLWSIKDSEFLFNFRRILVKLGVITHACPTCL